jgi:arylsulfatase
VILISIDTLRADHLSCYGYERDTTPEICAFFADGTRFENAYSQSSWTAPAHASIFTGLLPAQHGVTYGPLIPTLAGHPTIFQLFREQGYFTAALYGGGYVNPVLPSSHLDFKRVIELRHDLGKQLEDVLRSNSEARPFFLFLHGYDVHTPYAPKENYFVESRPEIDRLSRENRYCKYQDAADRSRYLDPESIPSDRSTQKYIESLYDSEILEVDRSLGSLFRHLRSRGLLDQTILILTSDHGEEFWEHGSCEHVKTVYNELLHVPLFVRVPGGMGRVESTPVAANVDILPTVVEALGWPALKSIDGESLFRPGPRDIFSEAQFHYDSQHLRRYSVVRGNEKLIYDANADARALFDLEADPGEQQPRTAGGAAERSLLDTLTKYIERGAPVVQHDGALDPQTLEQLKQLGYIE